ncbi:MAG: murein biosynthesis integral membrane protein MurJ [Acidobacteriota bacterium]
MNSIKVVLTGGGTGGHVYPNIAIYEALNKEFPDSKFLYIGSHGGVERKILKSISKPVEFRSVSSKGIPNKIKSFSTFVSLFKITIGTVKSFFILKKFKPDIVIGSGGYVAAPVLIAASLLKLKIFVHEQNAIPGRLNRFIARFAMKIGVSFKSTLKFFPPGKGVYTGYPLRNLILKKESNNIKEKLKIPENNKVIFAFGGSKGARTINNVISEIIPELIKQENLTLILSTGRGYHNYKAYEDTIKKIELKKIDPDIKGKLIIREYFDNIDEIYSISDLVIARAGAGTIEEISQLRLPSIIIPKIDLPGDHQIINAKEFEKTGGAEVVFEEIELINNKREIIVPENVLFNKINLLINSESRLMQMKNALEKIERINSAEKIIDEIKNLTEKKIPENKKDIKVYYLHFPRTEKNFELIFDNTNVGNSILSDIYIDGKKNDIFFELINFPDEEKIFLKRVKGNIEVNGKTIKKNTWLKVKDKLDVEGEEILIHRYEEKIDIIEDNKTTRSKIINSSFGIMASRIGGFFREVVILALFGARNITDIYVAGLTISNFMRRVVAENALENAFLPIYMRIFHRTKRKQMWEASSSIINFTILLSLIFTVTGILFAPQIIKFIYPGFQAKGILVETINITRLMFPYLMLVTFSAILATLLKAFNRFGVAEFSSLFFSVGSITGILIFYSISNLYALGIGVLLGGVLQILFLIPFVKNVLKNRSLEFKYSPVINFNSPVNKKYYSQLFPISTDVFLSKTAEIIDQFLASGLREGSISYLYFAKTIFRLPFAIISQAINSVILRDFADKLTVFSKDKAKRLFLDGIKINIFLLAPMSIIMFLLSEPIVSLLFERGKFGHEDVKNASFVLKFYSAGLIGWGLHSLTSRIFAARIDIKTSMYINFAMLMTNISLSFYLVETGLKYAGLALATTISFVLFSIIRIIVLKIKLSGEGIKIKYSEIYYPFLKAIVASFFMVIVMLQTKFIFKFINPGSLFFKNIIMILSLSFIGFSVYLITSLLMKNTEILVFKKKVFKKEHEFPVAMLSPFRFLQKVSKEPLKYRDDYLYKVNLYLTSQNWEVRNIGIKLVGLFKDKSKSVILKSNINSKKSNGFIRRNSINSLKEICSWNTEIKELIISKLDDPYYEVRVSAIDFLMEHATEYDYDSLKKVIRKELKNSTIEEKLSYIRLISRIGNKKDMELLKTFFLNSNSLLREELLNLLGMFHKRKILNGTDIKEYISQILLTSNNMEPEFKIKAIVKKIYKEIEKQ